MSWGAQSRSKDAKTPSVAGGRSKKPEPGCCPIQPYLKVYADSKADAGEVYQMKGDPAKRLWALVDRKDMVCTFPWKTMASEQRAVMIPPSVRRYFAADAGSRKVTTSTNGGKKE
jgi:hypothetical protein